MGPDVTDGTVTVPLYKVGHELYVVTLEKKYGQGLDKYRERKKKGARNPDYVSARAGNKEKGKAELETSEANAERLAAEIQKECAYDLPLRDTCSSFRHNLNRGVYELLEGEGGEPFLTDGEDQVAAARACKEFSGKELTADFGQSLSQYQVPIARG